MLKDSLGGMESIISNMNNTSGLQDSGQRLVEQPPESRRPQEPSPAAEELKCYILLCILVDLSLSKLRMYFLV